MRTKPLLAALAMLFVGSLFLATPAHATTLGLGGIVTSQGIDISVLVLPSSAGFTEILQVFPNFTQPNGPPGVPVNVALNTATGQTICIWANGATCGPFSVAHGQASLVPGPVPFFGTEVVFGINIPANQLGFTYPAYTLFTGPGARNPDGLTHNNSFADGPQPGGGGFLFNVGFEDLQGRFVAGVCQPPGFPVDGQPCSDRDFNDTMWQFNIIFDLPPQPGATEPSSLLLLGSGLAGLSGIAWRRLRSK